MLLDERLRHKQIRLVELIISPVIDDQLIRNAFLTIPRHLFVEKQYETIAYDNQPLPIGFGQTISQPLLVAEMIELLKLTGEEKVLEIGTGSGYQTALLSLLCRQVYSVERIPQLAIKARKILKKLGLSNIQVVEGNGTLGLPNRGPFDAIIVTASSPEVPPPLVEQLLDGGRIVIPLWQTSGHEILNVGFKQNGKLVLQKYEAVKFVPLLGEHGFHVQKHF